MVAIPVVADQEVDYFKSISYLKEYKYHSLPRCEDVSGYLDILP